MSPRDRTIIPDQASVLNRGDISSLRARQLRALSLSLREERIRIQEQALYRGSSDALGERLMGVHRLETACAKERARRRRASRVGRLISLVRR